MPPKTKITEEALLECAYKIAEENGITAVTSRSVAKLAGCSIQPVFSHFPTMEDLRQATYNYACRRLMDEILVHQNEPDFLQFTNRWVLALARQRPNLFQLLYLSNHFSSANLWDTMMEWECNRIAISSFAARYGLAGETAKDIFLRCFFLLFGIAAMVSADQLDMSDEQALDLVRRTAAELTSASIRQKEDR